MSVETNTLEEVKVRNVNDKTRAFIKELIRHYSEIDYDVCGLAEISTSEGSYSKRNCDDENLCSELNGKNPDNPFWTLLKGSEAAYELRVKLSYSGSSELYGYCYWQNILNNELRDFVSVRCLEYYDQDDEIVSYEYSDRIQGLVPWKAEFCDIESIPQWYSYNFGITLEPDDTDLCEGLCREFLENFTKEIGEKFGIENVDFDSDYYSAYGSVSLKTEQLNDFRKFLQDFLAFCHGHEMEPEIIAPFTADDNDFSFAALEFKADGSEITADYCKY